MQFTGFPEQGFRFLRALRRHNDRDWFLEHKQVYLDQVRAPMEALVEAIGDRLSLLAPEFVAHPKTSIYRIYRDTRFSHDKRPYKTHIAAVFPHRDLGRHQGAGFYVHVSPDEVFAGGGLYRPDRSDLQAVRLKLAEDHRTFRRLTRAPAFKRMFGDLSGERLVRVPRGFSPDHPAADLLRWKQYLAGRTLPVERARSGRFPVTLVATFQTLLPICRFLNDAILQDRTPASELRRFPGGDQSRRSRSPSSG